MKTPKEITVSKFHDLIKRQGRARIEDVTFQCPMCKSLQSAQDFIDAGVGKTFDDVEKLIAFSCLGRWTGGRPAFDKDGKPNAERCDWTLGGLFPISDIVVIDDEGQRHPRFLPTKTIGK